MIEPTDIDVLIATAEAMREQLGEDYPKTGSILDLWLRTAAELREAAWRFNDAENANADNMAFATEVQADLARARERADEAQAYASHALADRAESQADLARAREVIENAQTPEAREHWRWTEARRARFGDTDCVCTICGMMRHLTEFDQKEKP